jgi:hypothetical protein
MREARNLQEKKACGETAVSPQDFAFENKKST